MPDCQVARLGREEAVSGRLYRREDARQDGAVGVVDASSTRYEVCAPLEPVPIEDGGAVPVDVKADRSWIVVVSRPDNVGDGISRPRARKHPCRVLQRVARVLDVQMYLARQERRECGQERVQVAHHARVHQPVEGRYSRAPREPIPLDTCSIEGGHFASNQSLYRPEQQSADLAALGLNPMGVGASIEILPPLRNTPRGYNPGGWSGADSAPAGESVVTVPPVVPKGTPSRTAMLKTDNAHRMSGPRDHFQPERPHLVCRLTRSPGSTHDSAPSRVVIRLKLQLVPPRPKHDGLVSGTTCSDHPVAAGPRRYC